MDNRRGDKRRRLDEEANSISKDAFTFTIDSPDWKNVSGVHLRRTGDGENTNWVVEGIREEANTTGDKDSSIASKTQMYSATAWSAKSEGTYLPQYDPNPAKRKAMLSEQRKLYEYEQRQEGLPCQVKKVPELHISHYAKAALEAVLDKIDGKAQVFIHSEDWKDLNDVKNIFGGLFPAPSDFTRWNDDVKFGMQRFAGTNNEVIRLCTEIPKKLAVTTEMLKPFLESNTLESAIHEKRLFYIDHSILKECQTRSGSVVCSPIALFYRQNDNNIVPIAIQLFQDIADDNPVFLPSDGKYTWILAKMWFNNADACVHQAITHLGYTHIVMEGFAASVHRNLSQSHPMFKLMAPHFFNVMTINYLAVGTLLAKGNFMDTVMSVGTEGAYELIRRYRNKWRLNVEGTLPADLKERGVDSPEVVPVYPFRDDALLTYTAILQYVTDYVRLYYPSDTVLSQDFEIQKWRAELTTPIGNGGLAVLGVEGTTKGTFASRDQLIQVVTSIIYTCSVGHAGANFKQYDEYAFPMNYPSKLRGEPPRDKRNLSESDMLQAIQDRSDHYQLLTITQILSEHSFGKALGDFDENYICDQNALDIVNKFREALRGVHATIQERNSKRPIRYDYVDPILIPNSISI